MPLAGAGLLLVLVAAGCGPQSGLLEPTRLPEPRPLPPAPAPEPAPPPGNVSGPPETFVGAGDIAVCGSRGAEETARLLDGIPGTVFTAGDNTYPSGTARSFRDCYDPTWGRHRARTRPAPGNHDYDVPGATDYFAYFGSLAGDTRGYYSFQLGAWLILSLNSNVPADEGSPQYGWLRGELAARPTRCALAYWHHPVVTSGPRGHHPHMQPLWRLLADAGVELVISGHDHLYERFAPMSRDLAADPNGMRLFIAGTGGAPPYPVVSLHPASEIRASVWGVLKLTLGADFYDWQFVGVPGAGFSDAGSARCR
jgi:hypothetical protein